MLAVRRGSKPIDAGRIDKNHWKKPAQTVRFNTVVGERLLLRIEEDNNEGEWESLFPRRKSSGNMGANPSAHHNNTSSVTDTLPGSAGAPSMMAIPSWGSSGRW